MTSGRDSYEDYLEAILVIRRERGWCRNVDIAERLGVTRIFRYPEGAHRLHAQYDDSY